MAEQSIIMTRRNPILATREGQLARNRLALDGGRPYIDARLWRAPNESELSWQGAAADPGSVARRDRACCINDAGRIASKINQYLFSQRASRPGVDPDWAADVTNEGDSLDQFWMGVSNEMTACQWCWIQTDRAGVALDEEGQPQQRTLADKAADGDFVFWRLWPAVSVPDWYYDEAGNLVWLITHEESVDASDPYRPPVSVETRTLWRRAAGGAVFQRWQSRDGVSQMVAEGTISPLEEVPFVCVGKPSPRPWWFDDVEMIQAQLMNLDSLHIENLVRAVFPQLIIPESMLSALETQLVERVGAENGRRIVEAVREVVRGLDTPLVESVEDKGITRFIQPSMSDLNGMPTEAARKRQLLFDQVGLALFNRETRQVQSAESKQFDHLDTESTLRHRSGIMQTAERRLVTLSHELDPTWSEYEPEWPTAFDVKDTAADAAALTQLAQFGHLTLTQRKVVLKGVTKLMQDIVDLSEEESSAISEEIDALQEDDFALPVAPDYARRNGDEDEEGREEGEE